MYSWYGKEETPPYLLCLIVVSSAALQISKFLPVAVAERVANEESL